MKPIKPAYEKWYHTKRWERRAYFQKQEHPLCKMCLEHGIVTPAVVADHVIPHHGDPPLFWFGELQSLCSSHHSGSKQQLENKGYVDDIGVDGFPVDEKHPFNKLK